MNLPLVVLQPRPVELTERPGWTSLNGARAAFSYTPVVSCCPRGAARVTSHHSEPVSALKLTEPAVPPIANSVGAVSVPVLP